MKYLIDTDWVVLHLKGSQAVSQKLEEFSPHDITISIISLAELYEGIYYSQNPVKKQKLLEEFLCSGITVLNLNESIIKTFAEERGKLRKRGELIDNFDLLIASTALYYDLTVLTNNRKHFERIAGLDIMSI